MVELVWSYSMLDTFETCPKKWHDKYILKNKEPETEALRYGNYVHKSIEQYLNNTAQLPADLHSNFPIVESIKMAVGKLLTEEKMGLTQEIKPTDFFGKGVWGRGAADVVKLHGTTAFLGDWKTGKRRDKKEQLEILAMFLFKHYQKLDKITACNLWLKSNEMGDVYTFNRSDEAKMWENLLVRLKKMYNAVGTPNAETMTPGFLCGYCPVKSCRFNKS